MARLNSNLVTPKRKKKTSLVRAALGSSGQPSAAPASVDASASKSITMPKNPKFPNVIFHEDDDVYVVDDQTGEGANDHEDAAAAEDTDVPEDADADSIAATGDNHDHKQDDENEVEDTGEDEEEDAGEDEEEDEGEGEDEHEDEPLGEYDIEVEGESEETFFDVHETAAATPGPGPVIIAQLEARHLSPEEKEEYVAFPLEDQSVFVWRPEEYQVFSDLEDSTEREKHVKKQRKTKAVKKAEKVEKKRKKKNEKQSTVAAAAAEEGKKRSSKRVKRESSRINTRSAEKAKSVAKEKALVSPGRSLRKRPSKV